MTPSARSAFRGALGFLTRLPVGRAAGDWTAFRSTPVAFPLAGVVVGVLLLPAAVLPFPPGSVGLAFAVWVYLVTGINHVDGLADLGDAAAVHGDANRRRSAMTDTDTGVGAVLAIALVALGLVLAGAALAALPRRAVGIVVAAEVAAKLGMAFACGLGTAAHDGLGSQLTERAGGRSLVGPTLVAVPVVVVTWPSPAAAAALVAGVVAAVAVLAWARRRLGGVSGDVIGATNEVARVVALHVGVIAWTHW